MAQSDTIQPVAPGERILALDVLRGFAMFGVLVAYCMWSLGTAPEDTYAGFDRGLQAVAEFAIDGKFYTILAFLFGLGFSLQLGRAAEDRTAVRVYCRRLAALAAIGLAHSLLLRNGDILLPYAMTGFLLIPLRRSPDWLLFLVAGIALLIPPAARAALDAARLAMPERPDLANAPYLVENSAWVLYWWTMIPFTWPTNLVLFLFGFWAGRRRLLTRLAGDAPRLTAMLVIGVVAGAGFSWLLRMQMADDGAGAYLGPTGVFLSYQFHCWGLASAYAAALLLALRSRSGAAAFSPLAAIGRLALTNYLLQAALIVPLCLAFGWFDRFTPSTALLLALVVFLLQLGLSAWWLRRYRFGPAEWVWRMLAYGRVPPMRLASGDYAPV